MRFDSVPRTKAEMSAHVCRRVHSGWFLPTEPIDGAKRKGNIKVEIFQPGIHDTKPTLKLVDGNWLVHSSLLVIVSSNLHRYYEQILV